jgi:hypothetical protein
VLLHSIESLDIKKDTTHNAKSTISQCAQPLPSICKFGFSDIFGTSAVYWSSVLVRGERILHNPENDEVAEVSESQAHRQDRKESNGLSSESIRSICCKRYCEGVCTTVIRKGQISVQSYPRFRLHLLAPRFYASHVSSPF